MKHGLADVVESPAMITDIGMKAAAQVFTNLRNLTVYNCPHLHLPSVWFTGLFQYTEHLTFKDERDYVYNACNYFLVNYSQVLECGHIYENCT